MSSDNQQFLDLLMNSCELQSGCINFDEYVQRKEAWQHKLTGAYALSQRLEALRLSIIYTDDIDERIRLTNELRPLVEEIFAESTVPEPSKLQAQLTQLHAEGLMLCFNFVAEVSGMRMRIATRLFHNPQQDLQCLLHLNLRWAKWTQEIEEALQKTISQKYSLLVADAFICYSNVAAMYISGCEILSTNSCSSLQTSEKVRDEAQKRAEQASEIYHKSGHVEGEIRAKLILAELLYLANEKERSQIVAQEIYLKAEIMGYASLARQSSGYATGRPLIEDILEETRLGTAEDNDAVVAAEDDAFGKRYAKSFANAHGLPENRLPIVERDAISMRDIARERIDWCRHIELIQDLTHTQHPSTYYQQDPDRHCLCTKHNYESLIGNPDWKVVIATFKQTRCMNCPDRFPKNQEGASDG